MEHFTVVTQSQVQAMAEDRIGRRLDSDELSRLESTMLPQYRAYIDELDDMIYILFKGSKSNDKKVV